MFKLKKVKNGKSLKPSTTYFNVIAAVFIILSITSIVFLSACGSMDNSTEKIGMEDARSEETVTDSAPDDSIEGITAIEDQPPANVNYQGLQTGAEMVGYIPSVLCTDTDNYIRIDITNTSEFAWRNKRPGIVRIGYHYYGQDVDFVDYDKTARTELPSVVEPGETVSVNVLINDIVNPGYYIIQIDPVIEGNEIPEDNFWFSSKGVKMIEGLSYFDSCSK